MSSKPRTEIFLTVILFILILSGFYFYSFNHSLHKIDKENISLTQNAINKIRYEWHCEKYIDSIETVGEKPFDTDKTVKEYNAILQQAQKEHCLN